MGGALDVPLTSTARRTCHLDAASAAPAGAVMGPASAATAAIAAIRGESMEAAVGASPNRRESQTGHRNADTSTGSS
jgi:hypothetical protein